MDHIILGTGLGLAAGCIAILLMLPMAFSDKRTALTAAFFNRFSIGFLAATTTLPLDPISAGALIGLLLSVPDALITKAYLPIIVIGTILGALAGVAVWHWG